jgi:hypothetical protein
VGGVARRQVAWVAAVVLVVEALVIAAVGVVLAAVVGGQHMSLAGLRPSAMSAGAWGACAAAALFLLVCAVIVLRAAVKDRAPGGPGRVVLIICAVVHGVLGALAVGLLGWPVFVFAVVVLGLVVWLLLAYGRGHGAEPTGQAAPPGQVRPTSQ